MGRLPVSVFVVASALWVYGAYLFSPRVAVLVAALLVSIWGVLLVEVEK